MKMSPIIYLFIFCFKNFINRQLKIKISYKWEAEMKEEEEKKSLKLFFRYYSQNATKMEFLIKIQI